jgi:hypothetical protein
MAISSGRWPVIGGYQPVRAVPLATDHWPLFSPVIVPISWDEVKYPARLDIHYQGAYNSIFVLG